MEISQKIFELEVFCSKFLKVCGIDDSVLGDYNCNKYHLDTNAVTRVIAVLKVASEFRRVSKVKDILLNEIIDKLLEIKSLWQNEKSGKTLEIVKEASTFDLAFINNCIDFFNNTISHSESSNRFPQDGSILNGMYLKEKTLRNDLRLSRVKIKKRYKTYERG